jgi:TatA/E family protein of Tat protein translocase
VIASIFSGVDDMIVIVVALVVVFGGSQLPKLAHNTGEALREFRKARADVDLGASPAMTVAAAPVPATLAMSAARPAADTVTLTRGELDRLLTGPASDVKAEAH